MERPETFEEAMAAFESAVRMSEVYAANGEVDTAVEAHVAKCRERLRAATDEELSKALAEVWPYR